MKRQYTSINQLYNTCMNSQVFILQRYLKRSNVDPLVEEAKRFSSFEISDFFLKVFLELISLSFEYRILFLSLQTVTLAQKH